MEELQEYKKVMGLSGWLHWTAHFITNFNKLALAVAVITLILCIDVGGKKIVERSDPSLIPGAVEETLRYWAPSQYQGRFSHQDSEWHGVTLPAGQPVFLITGAANRDPREYDRPDEFDIDRPIGLTLGLGHGIHSCLGAALARLESRMAIEEWARRFPRYEVDDAGCARVNMSNVAGYSEVPVRVG